MSDATTAAPVECLVGQRAMMVANSARSIIFAASGAAKSNPGVIEAFEKQIGTLSPQEKMELLNFAWNARLEGMSGFFNLFDPHHTDLGRLIAESNSLVSEMLTTSGCLLSACLSEAVSQADRSHFATEARHIQEEERSVIPR